MESAIATATDLFHRRGYDGVGVAELSKAMGITAPSLYSAFGNKRSLFEQVLQHYVQTNGGWLTIALAREGNLEHKMTYFFASAAEVYTADPERCGCLVMDAARNCGDEDVRGLTAGLQAATQQLIYDAVVTCAPELSASAANALSDYVLMVLVGLSGRARDGVSAETLKTTAKIAASGFVQQLRQCCQEATEAKP